MKSFKYITTLFLSLMICYTSSGINLFVHFCGGKIYTICLSKIDAACGMEKTDCQSLSSKYTNNITNADSCCKNSLVKNKAKFNTFEKVDYSSFFSQIFAPDFYIIVSKNILLCGYSNNYEDITPHFLTSPFRSEKNIYMVNQNFRI
ncbi:MAG: hypothetical protein H7098_00365 [Oligoflexus sp.]|nr:hypothetical protein [Pseudopedobacter sp.]